MAVSMTSCTNDNDDNPVAPLETKQLAEYTILYYANGGGNVDRFILPMISDFYKVNPDAYKKVNVVVQHNYRDKEHIQSVAAIPQIIEKSIYMESEKNTDKKTNPTVEEFQHYVCGLKIGDEDYTVHSLIAIDSRGNRYYDHNLTHIEKGKLLDHISGKAVIDGFGTTPGTKPTTNSERKVNKLISILQTNKQKSVQNQRILNHVDKLIEKLGTKERTTIYHSLDEVPEEERQHIIDAHKRGRKVRGWYENGQIYLFLPDIDSEYQAEKTIWHETVAHHGLRELIGAQNQGTVP